MDEISKTITQFKDFAQLQEYANAQLKTITLLSKKIQKLEEEKDHLKKLLEDSVPLIKTQPEGTQVLAEDDSEYICTVEIAKLKKITMTRELTFEESKRLDTYFKILTQINSRNKSVEKEAEKIPTEDLLKLVEGEKKDGNK